jgi:nucleoside-specific outer membrane channel protein Tsx
MTAVVYAKLATAGLNGQLAAEDVAALKEVVVAEKALADKFGQQRKFWTQEPVQVVGSKVYQRNDLFDPNYVDKFVLLEREERFDFLPYTSEM